MGRKKRAGLLVLFFLGNMFLLGGRVKAGMEKEFIKKNGGVYYEKVEVLTQGKENDMTETEGVKGGSDLKTSIDNKVKLEVYTKKYKVPFLSEVIKSEIKGLLHSDEGMAIFHSNGEMEVRDDYIGQKRIADYIKEVKKAWLSEWRYRIEIIEWKKDEVKSFFTSGKERRKKAKNIVYEGVVLPLVEGRIGYAGKITIIPQAGMYMFNVILPEWGIQEAFIVKGDSDNEDFVKGNIEVRVFLKRISQ